MADAGSAGHDLEHFSENVCCRSCASISHGLSGGGMYLSGAARPLLFKNYVFEVFRVKLSAKNNEMRMVWCTLKLGRHDSFSGLLRLKKSIFPSKCFFWAITRGDKKISNDHRIASI